MHASSIECKNSHGQAVSGVVIGLPPSGVAFEVCEDALALQMSEVLQDFSITIHGRRVYAGRAVVRSLVHGASGLVCEATLEEARFDADWLRLAQEPALLAEAADSFIRDWQRARRLRDDFKLVVVDIQSFLAELKSWTQGIQLGLRSTPAIQASALERAVVQRIAPGVEAVLTDLFERLEEIASAVEPESLPVHGTFAKRILHPYLLASPFLRRVYQKPLGYPGDYEMVNMILRDPIEGESLFAKCLNRWILGHVPAVGHRNRIQRLVHLLTVEAVAARSRGRRLRVLNVGCGPAREVVEFIHGTEIADEVDFTLLDFNEETLTHVKLAFAEAARRSSRRPSLEVIKQSVAQLVRRPARTDRIPFDFIYCAGLFDYLTDHICRELIGVLARDLAVGGLLVLTNVEAGNPLRHFMDLIVDWRLIYRTADAFFHLVPSSVSADDVKVGIEGSGSNLFLEIRKSAPRPS